MIVSSEQSLGRVFGRIVQVFSDGPRDRETIEGGSPASNLIKQHERTRRCAVKDCRRLRHLHHEGAASTRKIVRRANARPNAIKHRQASALRRNEAAHLRQDRNQSSLAQDRAFATHVWTSDDQQTIRRVVKVDAVRNKRLFTKSLDHCMTPLHNFDLIAVMHRWPYEATS